MVSILEECKDGKFIWNNYGHIDAMNRETHLFECSFDSDDNERHNNNFQVGPSFVCEERWVYVFVHRLLRGE